MSTHSRIKIVKKYNNEAIKAYVTHDEIGAEMDIDAFKMALKEELYQVLPESFSLSIKHPTKIMTRKGIKNALNAVSEAQLKVLIEIAVESILSEMKLSTVAVAGLNSHGKI